ncbi:uncharacterized protein MELLADRAFT_104381 [Melampsora larici-populina 98AG31]|uniref:Secreted protein n=1 Tax=Melampsora larici-populina (strain 98AG31 / pathotype 3-4-7) TaxID=747676 RepID=F4REH9_MELLP|nr:uncharacterized protein MELLADRAFT_104381 [Melampsora larici-populina 98AG31]EGG09094.1 hypothetical protein MELLADRAFT_104381 [Melampsora larici-populina 98AG31]
MWQLLIQLYIFNGVISGILPDSEDISKCVIRNAHQSTGQNTQSGFSNTNSYYHPGTNLNSLPNPDLLIPISFVPVFTNEEHARIWARSGNIIIHHKPDLSLYDIRPVTDHIRYSDSDTSSKDMAMVPNIRPEVDSKNMSPIEMTSTHVVDHHTIKAEAISKDLRDHGENGLIATPESFSNNVAHLDRPNLIVPHIRKGHFESLKDSRPEEVDPVSTHEHTYSNKPRMEQQSKTSPAVEMDMTHEEKGGPSLIHSGDKHLKAPISYSSIIKSGHNDQKEEVSLKDNWESHDVKNYNNEPSIPARPLTSLDALGPQTKPSTVHAKTSDVIPSAKPDIGTVDKNLYAEVIHHKGKLRKAIPKVEYLVSKGKHVEYNNDENLNGVSSSKIDEEWRLVSKKNRKKGKQVKNNESISPEIPNVQPGHVSSYQDDNRVLKNEGGEGAFSLELKTGTKIPEENKNIETFPSQINDFNLSASSSQLEQTETPLSKSSKITQVTRHKKKKKKNNSKQNVTLIVKDESKIDESNPSTCQLHEPFWPQIEIDLSEKKKIAFWNLIEKAFQKHNKNKFIMTLIDHELYAQEIHPVNNMQLNTILNDMQVKLEEKLECSEFRETYRRMKSIGNQLMQEISILEWDKKKGLVSKEVATVAQLLKVNERWPMFFEYKSNQWDSLQGRMAKLTEVQQNELDSLMDTIEQGKRCATIYTMQNPEMKRYKKWLAEQDPKRLSQLGVSIPILLNLLYTLDFLSPEIEWDKLNSKILHKKSEDFLELLIGKLTASPNVYTLESENSSWNMTPTRMYIGEDKELEIFIQKRLRILTKFNRFKIQPYIKWYPTHDTSLGSIQQQNLSFSEIMVGTYFGVAGSELAYLKSLMDEKSKRCIERGSGEIEWPKAAFSTWIVTGHYLEKYYKFLGLTVHPPEYASDPDQIDKNI